MFGTTERRRGLPEARRLGSRVYSLVLESDTTATKFSLMAFAFLQGIAFPLNASCPYIACRFLEDVMPYEFWSSLFLSYVACRALAVLDTCCPLFRVRFCCDLGIRSHSNPRRPGISWRLKTRLP
jgi:hypothetical protein